MKVLLISPNVESLPDPVFPLGLAYIAGALREKQIPYHVLDLCFEEDFEAAICQGISLFEPDIIGLSLRNVDNVSYPNYISYLPFYRQVVRVVRKYSRGVIVVGGSGFDLLHDKIIKYLGADLGIIGEGETAFARLIDRLEKEGSFYDALDDRVLDAREEIIKDLDFIPVPDRSGFDNTAYLSRGGMGNIQTKRGCPFGCIYCTYPIIQGKTVRLRTPAHVCDEIESLLEAGIDNIFIVDNEFNFPIDHAQELCSKIIERRLSFKWSCYCHPGFVTERLVELMLSAGCTGMEFGSDAANDNMIINLGKNFTVSDLHKVSKICLDSGMSFCHSLLIGGPGETLETVRETFDAIISMSPTAVICMTGIRIFPDTRLCRIAIDQGVISPDQDLLDQAFYISPAIKDEMLPFIEQFSKDQPTWIFPGLNININIDLQKKLRRFGIKGPLWEYMRIGARYRNITEQPSSIRRGVLKPVD